MLDLASGSGLCAIAAMRAGAASVTAVDIDPFSIAAIGLNAKANRQKIDVRREDLLGDDPPPDVDVILAGDCWYEESFGHRVSAWLLRAARARDRRADRGSRQALPGSRHAQGARVIRGALDD